MKQLETLNTLDRFGKRFDSVSVLVHDGIYGVHTGAGTSNHRFIITLAGFNLGSKLNILPIFTSTSNPNYQPQFFSQTQETITSNGGEIVPIGNLTDGMESFGYAEHWEAACNAAIQAIKDLCIKDGRNLIVSFDTPFVFLHQMLEQMSSEMEIFHVHIPHSTGILHDPSYIARVRAEKKSFTGITTSNFGALGSTCSFMKNHLAEAYGVDKQKIIPLTYGVLGSEYSSVDPNVVKQTTESLGIEEGEKFVLAYGRAMPYKGFHIFLDALTKIKESSLKFVLIAAAREGSNEYTESLQKIIDEYELQGKLITHFDLSLPRILQRSPQLAAVVVPSLEEPFGLIPIENFANPYSIAPVIASSVGGLQEQIIDGYNGYTFTPGDSEDLARKIQEVLAMSPLNRISMKKVAFEIAREKYNYESNIITFLSYVLSLS